MRTGPYWVHSSGTTKVPELFNFLTSEYVLTETWKNRISLVSPRPQGNPMGMVPGWIQNCHCQKHMYLSHVLSWFKVTVTTQKETRGTKSNVYRCCGYQCSGSHSTNAQRSSMTGKGEYCAYSVPTPWSLPQLTPQVQSRPQETTWETEQKDDRVSCPVDPGCQIPQELWLSLSEKTNGRNDACWQKWQ